MFSCKSVNVASSTRNNVSFIHPNPSTGNFNLSVTGLSGTTAIITVFDLYGKRIYNAKAIVINGEIKEEIDLAPNGFYLLNIIGENGTHKQKIEVNK